MHTPVAFIIFNRPDTTARVFAAIREARPATLLVVADGPRAERAGEAERCAQARAIIDGVDWPCEVLTNYSEVNLGCKRRVSSGLDWVFSTVEEAIILEDDCLPHPTFFPFCEELLDRFRHDERIMMISGDNFQYGRHRTDYSYYFSRYTHIWGWASWRRAWQHYDVTMACWPEIRDGGWLGDLFTAMRERDFWVQQFDRVYNGYIDTWDYQWTLACWIQHGLSVVPNVNLVTNIGFGDAATHTNKAGSRLAHIPNVALEFPLCHPLYNMRDVRADRHTAYQQYMSHPVKYLLKKVLGFYRSSK